MVNRLKEWIASWTFIDNLIREKAFEHYLREFDDFDKDADKELCRNILKVKDFSQVKRPMSPDERKQYVADAAFIHHNQAFKDIINEIQYDTALWIARESDTDRQLMIARGTINGADIIESRIAALASEHAQNVKDAQPVSTEQQFGPIPTLETNN